MTDVGDAAIGVTRRRTDLQLVTSEIDLKTKKFNLLRWALNMICNRRNPPKSIWNNLKIYLFNQMGSKHDLKRFLKSIFLQMLSGRDLKPPKSICNNSQKHISSNEQWTWLETLNLEKTQIF
jgi:hypothetical protein